MKDNHNFKWTIEDIAEEYKLENPNWTWDECLDKSKIIYKELNKLNTQMWGDNRVYYKFFKPFSFFESDDGKWSSLSELNDI